MQNNSIETFLEFIDDEYRVSHIVIAEKTDNLPQSILDLITRNILDFEEFGNLRFEIVGLKRTTKSGLSRGFVDSKVYYLNEQQATLLMTYLRNSEKVRNFKKRLVKEFYRMREEIKSKNHQTVQVQNDGFDIKLYTQQSREIFELVEIINSKNIKTLYFADNLYKKLNLQSPLELLKIYLSNYYFIPTELGKLINSSAIETNKILEARGLQTKQNGVWKLTEKGRDFAIEVQNGSFLQIKWNLKAIFE